MDTPLLVENASTLQDFGEDGYGRVDGVGDNADHCFGAMFGTCFSEVSDDGRIGVLEVTFTLSLYRPAVQY